MFMLLLYQRKYHIDTFSLLYAQLCCIFLIKLWFKCSLFPFIFYFLAHSLT